MAYRTRRRTTSRRTSTRKSPARRRSYAAASRRRRATTRRRSVSARPQTIRLVIQTTSGDATGATHQSARTPQRAMF